MEEIEVLDLDPPKKKTNNKKLKKKKRRLKKITKIIIFIILGIVIIGGVTTTIIYKNKIEKEKEEERIRKEKELVEDIKSHYNSFVKVSNDTKIYQLEDNKYQEIGMVFKDTELTLNEIEINKDTKYFEVKELGLISYQDVNPIEELSKVSDRYKKYIPYNKNIITKENYTLYSEDGNKRYQFNTSNSYPIIINNYENKYYVEYKNELMYILNDDVSKTENHTNTTKTNAKTVTTLCYHRVYTSKDSCTDPYICIKESLFDKEMKYLKDNKYVTLTMQEMYLYLNKKLQIPKGVVVTFDDGYLIKNAIPILEKYDLYGISFVITSRFKDLKDFKSDHLEIQTHTDKLHTAGVCAKEYSYQQGGGLLCTKEKDIISDINKSIEFIGTDKVFALAYPFYDFNDHAINALKKTPIKMGFIGVGSTNGKASPGTNLYKIPRRTIWDTTSFDTWKSYL